MRAHIFIVQKMLGKQEFLLWSSLLTGRTASKNSRWIGAWHGSMNESVFNEQSNRLWGPYLVHTTPLIQCHGLVSTLLARPASSSSNPPAFLRTVTMPPSALSEKPHNWKSLARSHASTHPRGMNSLGIPVHAAVPPLQLSITHWSHAAWSPPRHGIRQKIEEQAHVSAQQSVQVAV